MNNNNNNNINNNNDLLKDTDSCFPVEQITLTSIITLLAISFYVAGSLNGTFLEHSHQRWQSSIKSSELSIDAQQCQVYCIALDWVCQGGWLYRVCWEGVGWVGELKERWNWNTRVWEKSCDRLRTEMWSDVTCYWICESLPHKQRASPK